MVERFRALAPDFAAGEYENTFTNEQGEERVIAWRAAPVLGPDGSVGEHHRGRDRHHRAPAARRGEGARAGVPERDRQRRAEPPLPRSTRRGRSPTTRRTRRSSARSTTSRPRRAAIVFWERYVDPAEAERGAGLIERVVAGEIGRRARPPLGDAARGDRLLIAWTCTPLPQVDERTMFLISGVDVTERKRREVELQRERDATTTVIQTIPSFIVVLDVDGVDRRPRRRSPPRRGQPRLPRDARLERRAADRPTARRAARRARPRCRALGDPHGCGWRALRRARVTVAVVPTAP